MEIFIILLFVLFLSLAIYLAFFKLKNRKKLGIEKIKDFQKRLKQINSNISSKEKVIDSDKLYHKILLEL
jgi:preprotein translocase subunit SecG